MLLVAAIAPAASAAEAILTDDTYEAATPMGLKRFLVLNRNQNVYLKFDLSNLPAGTTAEQISKATLKLWVRTSEGTAISVRNISQAAGTRMWNESTLTSSTPVTLEEFQNAQGKNLLPTNVPLNPVHPGGYFVGLDVTELVKAWQSGDVPNCGLAIVAAGESAPAKKALPSLATFASKENVGTGHMPNLEIILGSPAVTAAAGEPGPKGEKGDKGDKGDLGEQGIQGLKGDTGAAGPQGVQGIKGDTGETGPQGLKGDKGEQGIQGSKGDTGATGPQGLQGLKGDTGATGPQGLQGLKGDTGATGPQGLQGLKGDTGETGPQGLKGDKGDPGVQGPQGPQGPEGPQGPAGPASVAQVYTQAGQGNNPSSSLKFLSKTITVTLSPGQVAYVTSSINIGNVSGTLAEGLSAGLYYSTGTTPQTNFGGISDKLYTTGGRSIHVSMTGVISGVTGTVTIGLGGNSTDNSWNRAGNSVTTVLVFQAPQ